MDENTFRELYAESETADKLTFDVGGTPVSVPALVSTVSDEKALMIGGTLAKANWTARVCVSDTLPFITATRGLIGRLVSYAGATYRVVESRKHPRSAVVHLILQER